LGEVDRASCENISWKLLFFHLLASLAQLARYWAELAIALYARTPMGGCLFFLCGFFSMRMLARCFSAHGVV